MTSPNPHESRMDIEQIIERLAARGLMESEHNLTIWQCVAPPYPWGAAITTHNSETTAYGQSLREALETLSTEVSPRRVRKAPEIH